MFMNEKFISSISVKLIFYSFIFFTLISSFLCIEYGYYGGDLETIKMSYSSTYWNYFFIYYLLPTYIFYSIYKLVIKINFNFKIINGNNLINENFFHFIFFVLILFTVVIVNFTSVGTISREESNNRFVELFFALFQPIYLTIIYIIFFKDTNKLIYKINIFVFLFVLFLTGFTGYVLFFIPFILNFSIKNLGNVGTMLLIIIGIILLPFLRIFKFMIKHSLNFYEIIDMMNFNFFSNMIKVVIDRFNYVPNIIYVDENYNYFVDLFCHYYYPYYQGYLGSFFHKLIYNSSVENLNSELTYFITGFNDSNSTFPLVSYFSFDIWFGLFVSLYSLLIYMCLYFFIKLLGKNNYFNYIYFILGYLFLLQGWFWPFMNFLQAIAVFLFLIIFVNLLKRFLIYINGGK